LSNTTQKNNNIFCPYYYQGLLIDATPAGKSRISMCCWQGRHEVDTVKFDHEYLTQLREQSLTNIPTPCSKYCHNPNHIANERERSLGETWWDQDSTLKIKKLHLKQGLICNLTCISCGSMLSSAWNKDYRKFDSTAPIIRIKKDTNNSWSALDLTYVTQIHFDGGEPLLNTDNLQILQHLEQIGQIEQVTLNYSTNGTIWPCDETIRLWAKCKWVRLFFSLDGIGSTFEYTRYPAKWDLVTHNMKKFQELIGPCILLEANAIVGIHNIFNMPDFFEWWQKNLQFGNQGDPSQIFVRTIEPSSVGGRVLDLKYLPIELKDTAVNMLQSLSNLPGATDLIKLLSKEHSNEWLNYFGKLDQLRGTNWKISLPQQLSANYQ
jgi:hypothetical protein